MKLSNKQKSLGDALLQTMGNISEAIEISDCSLEDFNEFIKISEFKQIYEQAIQLQKDVALSKFMGLIEDGDRAAIIEYQKIQSKNEGLSESARIKREVMRILIENSETKVNCLKEYCLIFKCTQPAANDQFTKVVAEYNLITPFERQKIKKNEQDNSLSEKFKKGNLSEVEMYSSMLAKALYDSENSEYPSERSKARADVISINQRLEEIEERRRREAEQDNTNIFLKLDAVIAGTTVEEVAKLKERFSQNLLTTEDINAD